MDRSALRKRLRAERREFAAIGRPFPMPLQVEGALRTSRCAGFYRPAGSEADIGPWLDWCAGNGIATALPRLAGRDAAMEFADWQPGDTLVDSGLRFDQPASSAPAALPDVVLVPMLGFDRAMNRLGQGAGHYDRYFMNNRNAIRIGIAWSCQELPDLRSETWDVPMDAVCTEIEWICPENSPIVTA